MRVGQVGVFIRFKVSYKLCYIKRVCFATSRRYVELRQEGVFCYIKRVYCIQPLYLCSGSPTCTQKITQRDNNVIHTSRCEISGRYSGGWTDGDVGVEVGDDRGETGGDGGGYGEGDACPGAPAVPYGVRDIQAGRGGGG